MLFRCLRSGNTVEISDPEDVERMKFHEGYQPVLGENHGLHEKTPSPEDAATCSGENAEAKEVKKRGRPKGK